MTLPFLLQWVAGGVGRMKRGSWPGRQLWVTGLSQSAVAGQMQEHKRWELRQAQWEGGQCTCPAGGGCNDDGDVQVGKRRVSRPGWLDPMGQCVSFQHDSLDPIVVLLSPSFFKRKIKHKWMEVGWLWSAPLDRSCFYFILLFLWLLSAPTPKIAMRFGRQ